MARRSNRTGRRPRGLGTLSISQLQREIRLRQRSIGGLVRRRNRLAAALDRLDSQIESLGGALGGNNFAGGRRRPRNEMNLVEALQKLLAHRTMSVTEMTSEVQRAGYRTTSPNFRTIVNQTLINSGKFRRVSRGKYTAK